MGTINPITSSHILLGRLTKRRAEVVPRDPSLQDEQDAGQGLPVFNRWPTSFRVSFRFGKQGFNPLPQSVATIRCHNSSGNNGLAIVLSSMTDKH